MKTLSLMHIGIGNYKLIHTVRSICVHSTSICKSICMTILMQKTSRILTVKSCFNDLIHKIVHLLFLDIQRGMWHLDICRWLRRVNHDIRPLVQTMIIVL
jgi:hypothetical protein